MKSIAFIVLGSLLTVCTCISVSAEVSVPSEDTFKAWWKMHSKEELTFNGSLIAVHLRDKELAYIVPVSIFSRGRNFIDNAILIRPALKEARELSFKRDIEVYDLDHDGISEITSDEVASGQGSTEVASSIMQLDGWEPTVLYQVDYGNNYGNCGPPPGGWGECLSTDVSWQFKDIDGDGIDDLVEEITKENGPTPYVLHVTKTINKYLFKGNKFIRMEPSETIELGVTIKENPHRKKLPTSKSSSTGKTAP